MPRSIRTVASLGVYLAGRDGQELGDRRGGFMDDLGGLSMMSRKERDEFVVEKGELYAMGLVECDGLRIDEDKRIQRNWAD